MYSRSLWGEGASWLSVLRLRVNTSQTHANAYARVRCKLQTRSNRTRSRSREVRERAQHLRVMQHLSRAQVLSLRAHGAETNAQTHDRLIRKLRTRRAHDHARASNQHVPPLRACSREHATVHDHRETNTYPAQVCEHAFAGGEFSTVAPHTRCRTAPHCDRRCSLLRASSLKQREELLREPSSCTPRHHDRFAKIKFQRY